MSRRAEYSQKVLGTPAVVVDDDGTISLVCEKRSELIDQSPAVAHGIGTSSL